MHIQAGQEKTFLVPEALCGFLAAMPMAGTIFKLLLISFIVAAAAAPG